MGGTLVLFLNRPKNPLSSPLSTQTKEIVPSETLIEYTDPAGFRLSYPDNLSLLNNALKDDNTYAELQLVAKGIDGSLVLKISDSELTSLDEWVKTKKASSPTPKETKLGSLQAMEVTTDDKLLLGALDQEVLFTIEIPLGKDRDFWMKVYDILLANFSFVPPSPDSATSPGQVSSSADDVIFEGEEVVE